jgi:hypothetical protein
MNWKGRAVAVMWMAWMGIACADSSRPPLGNGGVLDAGNPSDGDAEVRDVAGPDAGPHDAGQPDAEPHDADPHDAGQPDAQPHDGGPPDAEPHDSGPDVTEVECELDGDCDDGNVCTGTATCVDAECVQGTPLACDDGLECTGAGCDPTHGCQHPPVEDGTPCSGGVCLDGACNECTDSGSCTCQTFGASVYWFCTQALDWTAARAVCLDQGFHLVHVDSTDENGFLWDVISAMGLPSDPHLGANDILDEGVWRWPDGSTFWTGDENGGSVDGRYNNWAPGEPNDLFGQDCAVMRRDDGRWDDIDCGSARPFICEGG